MLLNPSILQEIFIGALYVMTDMQEYVISLKYRNKFRDGRYM